MATDDRGLVFSKLDESKPAKKLASTLARLKAAIDKDRAMTRLEESKATSRLRKRL